MRKLIWTLKMFLLFGSAGLLVAADKSQFDIPETKVHQGLAKGSATALSGWKVTESVSEIAVLSGGYFTIGTTAGTSTSSLDNDCGILFGHPYAKTSYPFFQVDGKAWQKPETMFPPESLKATAQGDSVTLAFLGDPSMQILIVYRLINQGQQIQISSTVTNTDVVSHVLGLGFMIDPALGIRGDGVLSVGGSAVLSESWMSSVSIAGKQILLSERRGTHAGLKCSLNFFDGFPNTLAAGNWEELSFANGPGPTGTSGPPRIYDLVLKMYWDPISVAAKGELKRSFILSLETPDFGSGLFTRWDVPTFLTISNGVMYPNSLPTTVSVLNQHPASASATIHLALNNIVSSTGGDRTLNVPAGIRGNASLPIGI